MPIRETEEDGLASRVSDNLRAIKDSAFAVLDKLVYGPIQPQSGQHSSEDALFWLACSILLLADLRNV